MLLFDESVDPVFSREFIFRKKVTQIIKMLQVYNLLITEISDRLTKTFYNFLTSCFISTDILFMLHNYMHLSMTNN